MINDNMNHLIEAWLDGTIDDVGLAELEVAILESIDVRHEFWRRAALHGVLHEAAKIEFAADESLAGAASRPPRKALPIRTGRGAWLRGGIAAGMALLVVSGCGIGSVVTSLAFAYSGLLGRVQQAIIVHEEGFEHPPAPEQRHVPDRLDVWSGDETVVVGAEHGIMPRSGERMLKFLSPRPQGAVYRGLASEIWRVIDLESVRAAAGTREVRIDFSACFNGCQRSGKPRQCWISAIATDARPQDLGHDWEQQFEAAQRNPIAVATAQARERIDSDPRTWQRFSVTVTAPEGARYLLLHCLTEYRPDEDADVAAHCGQYVDDIDITVSAAAPAVVTVADRRQEVRR
ncbi:MAG: hypothetical protein WCR51_11155 [Planctomycetia bacterium]